MKKLTQCAVILRFKEVHGDLYDYSKVDYANGKTKVEIVCPTHGSFYKKVGKHFLGQGCPSCQRAKQSIRNTVSQDVVISRFVDIHNGKYGYDKVVYIGMDCKVLIDCHDHGAFVQTPGSHLAGHGCQTCAAEMTSKRILRNPDDVIIDFKKAHGERYGYSEVNYSGSKTPVKIICKLHGSFSQQPAHHANGSGCPKCKSSNSVIRNTLTREDVISGFIKTHGDRYDYSNVDYVHGKYKVEIICRTHGSFLQRPNDHDQGYGCPTCGMVISKPENEIAEFIESLGFVIKRNVRGLMSNPKLEADIYLPDQNIIIEYNGLRWHSEQFATNKFNIRDKSIAAKKAGLRCIHIREDQFLEKPHVIYSLLRSALGIFDTVIGARTTVKRELSNLEYRVMCSDHLQGFRPAKYKKGLFHGTTLVAAIGYNADGELVRFIVKSGYRVQGGLSKLIKDEAIAYSYCDLSFFKGTSYGSAGFTFVGNTGSGFVYTNNKKVVCRQAMQKHKLKKRFGDIDNSKTSSQICADNGWYRFYDAGNAKYTINQ